MHDALQSNEFGAVRARVITPVVETLGRMLTSQGREFSIDDSLKDRTSINVRTVADNTAHQSTVTFIASGQMIGIFDQNTGPALDSPMKLVSEHEATALDQGIVSAALTQFMADITAAG